MKALGKQTKRVELDGATFEINASLTTPVRNKYSDTFQGFSASQAKGGSITLSDMYGVYRGLVKDGLVSVSGLYDANGSEVKSSCPPSDAVLDLLSEVRLAGWDCVLNWLGAEIWKANQLTEEEKKTSGEPLT